MKTTDLRRKKAVTSDPLPAYLLKTFEAYLPHVLGVTAPEHAPLVREATERFDAYVQSLPPHENARDDLEQLLFVTWLFGTFFRFPPRAPWKQAASRRRAFVEHFYSDDETHMDTVVLRIADLGQALGVVVPRLRRKLKDFTLKDLAKSLREMMSLAFYSNPNADPSVTGYERIWDRSARYAHRPDVDRTALPRLRQPAVFDPKEAASIHQVGHPYDATRLFANDGRPKVAVIGTGAGGAVVAAKLAAEKKGGRPKYDVAVFDAGPRMSPGEYPLDTFVGMGRLFEAGLLTLTKDLDIHLLRGRVVGGGTVMTSGLSVRLRQGTKDAWTGTSGELAIGVGPEELDAGFEAVRERCHMAPMGKLDPALYTDASHLLEEGAEALGPDEPQWRFDADDAWNTVMMRASQHPGERPDQNGDWCFGCGLCNYGCHFGHKLSMDLTYVPDAIAAGAKLHPNLPIERLEGERDAHGQMQVTHLVLGRGLKARVKVDHVVLAAGAVGTPALLLRSAAHDPCWETLPPFRGDHVGTGLGFNYGSGVLGRWPTPFAKPGHFGFQIKYVATRAEDTPFEVKVSGEALANDPLRRGTHFARWVLENAFVPPGLISNLVPGVGAYHRRWMEAYASLAMCATTIGSPQTGRIHADRSVEYHLSDSEIDLNRQALAHLARLYFAAGAEEVGLAGLREDPKPDVAPPGEGLRLTRERFGDATAAQIEAALEPVLHQPEHIMLSSAHPQGGLRMSKEAEKGAVDERFQLRGAPNVSVMDASLFPSTIVVNPWWTISALAHVAAKRIAERI